MATDKMIAERPNDVKRWLSAMVKALMFIRDRPEEAADIALKKVAMTNISRASMAFGDLPARSLKAFPAFSPEGIKNVIEFEVKTPLKMKEDVLRKGLSLRLMREVKEELEAKR